MSFNCGRCGDVIKKPKVATHSAQCGSYSFTCVDCMVTFDLQTVKDHTSCITETDKYQGKWQAKKKPSSDEPKPPRKPTVFPSYSDSDDDFQPVVKKQRREPEKKVDSAATTPRSAPAKPVKHSPKVTPMSAKAKPAKDAAKAAKHALPPSSHSSVITVPSFELGSRNEVDEMIRAVIEAEGTTSSKVIAREFVATVYKGKLVKALQPVIAQMLSPEA